jgi:hypothetical protein
VNPLTLKFTRIVLISNLYFLVSLVTIAMYVAGYIFGYDLVGVFLGLYRNQTIDIVCAGFNIILLYILFDKQCFREAYPLLFCLCDYWSNRNENKGAYYEQTDSSSSESEKHSDTESLLDES